MCFTNASEFFIKMFYSKRFKVDSYEKSNRLHSWDEHVRDLYKNTKSWGSLLFEVALKSCNKFFLWHLKIMIKVFFDVLKDFGLDQSVDAIVLNAPGAYLMFNRRLIVIPSLKRVDRILNITIHIDF